MACQKWRESDYTWVSVADPPFNACDKSSGIIVEYDSSDSGYDSYRPETTFEYRVVFTSTYSKQTSWQVIDEFTVTFRDACYNLNLGLTTGVSDFTYRVESGATQVTKTPVFSEDQSGACTITTSWYGKLATDDEDKWQTIGSTSPINFASYGITVSSNTESLLVSSTTHSNWSSGPVTYDIKAVYWSSNVYEVTPVSVEAHF